MKRTHFSSNPQKMRILTLSHIQQANSIAWSFYRTSGIPFDDLKGEAELALCIAADKFDPKKKLCLSTFVQHCVTKKLISFCEKTKKHEPQLMDESKIAPDNSFEPSKTVEFFDSLNNLGKEASEIAKIILNGPAEILDIAVDSTPCKIRIALKKYMTDKGISVRAFGAGVEELKALFS